MHTRKHKSSLTTITHLVSITTLIILNICTARAHAATTKEAPHIRIAILPCADIVKTYTKYQPLKIYLQQYLHQKIEILVPSSFQEFKRIIITGEAEFAFQAPHAYITLANQYEKTNLLKSLTPQGASEHHGVIVTRKDSGIKSIADLSGKNFLFGHLYSTTKWVAAKSLLKEKGIDLNNNLKNYAHGNSCESIAMNVYLRQYDAGAICDYAFDEITENTNAKDDEIPPDGLIVIGSTWEIPTWVFATRKGVNQQTSTMVTDTLLGLNKQKPAHAKILKELDVGGFTEAQDSDYESLRKVLNTSGSTQQ